MRKLVLLALLAAALSCKPKVETKTTTVTHTTTVNIPENAAKRTEKDLVRMLPTFLQKSALGPVVGTDGMVSKEATNFKRGETVYLSLWLNESPVGLKTSAKWFDAANKVIDHEEHEMNGAKLSTFALKTASLKPGKYRAEGYWGGNLAAEKDFSITK